MATDGWYEPAIYNPARSNAGSHLGPVEVGILHKTISPYGSFRARSDSYFGHQNYPHFTTDVQGGKFKVWQHISLRKAAKALRNRTGGVQTNREGVIQVEIVGYANKSFALHTDPKLNDIHYEGLKALMRWIESQTEIPRSTGVEFHQYPPENRIRLGQEPWRLRGIKWTSYQGWAGHQHVDENEHGDPGLIDIDRLIDIPVLNPAPIISLEIDMFMVDDPEDNRQWMCGDHTKRWIKDWQEVLGNKRAGVPHLTEETDTVVMRRAVLAARKEVFN